VFLFSFLEKIKISLSWSSMEKEEDSKIDFLRSLYNREDFEIRNIRKSDGKEFVVIRSYTVRKEDFEDVKEIQDFLEVDGVIFLTELSLMKIGKKRKQKNI
jgi:hypothetical protein